MQSWSASTKLTITTFVRRWKATGGGGAMKIHLTIVRNKRLINVAKYIKCNCAAQGETYCLHYRIHLNLCLETFKFNVEQNFET